MKINNDSEMKNFQELIGKRRSIRQFTDELLTPEQVETILKAALKSPSSKNKMPWEFVVVEDKDMLQRLAGCKKFGSKPVAGCALAVVVLADPFASDIWVEDTSIASYMMQLQAEDLGLGSCWIQIRGRMTENENVSAEEYVKDLLDVPTHMQVLSIMVFGHKAQERPPYDDEKLQWEKIHIDKY